MNRPLSETPLDWVLGDLFPDQTMRAADWQTAADILHAYVDLELNGEDADVRYPNVQPALDTYPDLREEYQSLRSLLFDERHGLWADPSPARHVDLSFMRDPASLWRWVESGGNRTARLIGALHVQLSRTAAVFGQLPGTLVPQVAVVAVRDAGSGQASSEILEIATPEANSTISIQLGPIQGEGTLISLRLRPTPDEPTPRRTRISLLGDVGQLLASSPVDEAGWVTFREVRPGRYHVRVARGQSQWEVPLDIEGAIGK